jgi:hypothetical protein
MESNTPTSYEKDKAERQGAEDSEKPSGLYVALGLTQNPYNPPSDPVLKERYDGGWDDAKNK